MLTLAKMFALQTNVPIVVPKVALTTSNMRAAQPCSSTTCEPVSTMSPSSPSIAAEIFLRASHFYVVSGYALARTKHE
jgi:hypothetical protein